VWALTRAGLPRADAQDDFDRALRRALGRVGRWLHGQSSSRNRLLVLGDETIIIGAGPGTWLCRSTTAADHLEAARLALGQRTILANITWVRRKSPDDGPGHLRGLRLVSETRQNAGDR